MIQINTTQGLRTVTLEQLEQLVVRGKLQADRAIITSDGGANWMTYQQLTASLATNQPSPALAPAPTITQPPSMMQPPSIAQQPAPARPQAAARTAGAGMPFEPPVELVHRLTQVPSIAKQFKKFKVTERYSETELAKYRTKYSFEPGVGEHIFFVETSFALTDKAIYIFNKKKGNPRLEYQTIESITVAARDNNSGFAALDIVLGSGEEAIRVGKFSPGAEVAFCNLQQNALGEVSYYHPNFQRELQNTDAARSCVLALLAKRDPDTIIESLKSQYGMSENVAAKMIVELAEQIKSSSFTTSLISCLAGVLLAVIGIVITVASYNAASGGGTYVVMHGLILVGVVMALGGGWNMLKSTTNPERLLARWRNTWDPIMG